MRSLVLTLCFLAFASGLEEIKTNPEQKCVPLPQCEVMNWIWRHRDEINIKSKEEIEKFVWSLDCGLKVCPKEKKIKSRERNPLIRGPSRHPVRTFNFREKVNYKCQGHLKLHMIKSDFGPNAFHTQEIHSRSATLNFGRKSMKIFRIENRGTCCWEIFERLHFRGKSEKILAKFDGVTLIHSPTTAKVVDC